MKKELLSVEDFDNSVQDVFDSKRCKVELSYTLAEKYKRHFASEIVRDLIERDFIGFSRLDNIRTDIVEFRGGLGKEYMYDLLVFCAEVDKYLKHLGFFKPSHIFDTHKGISWDNILLLQYHADKETCRSIVTKINEEIK